MSFNMFRQSGPYLTDPRQLPRFSANAESHMSFINGSGAQNFMGISSNGPNVLAAASAGSVRLDSDWSADTYKTVTSIADGAGVIAGFLGPMNQSGNTTDVVTWRVTLDGAVYEFSTRAHIGWNGSFGSREYVGWVFGNNFSDGDAADHNRPWGLTQASASLDGTTFYVGSPGFILPAPHDPRIPVLVEFRHSLHVEAKANVAIGSGGANARDCVVSMFRTR